MTPLPGQAKGIIPAAGAAVLDGELGNVLTSGKDEDHQKVRLLRVAPEAHVGVLPLSGATIWATFRGKC